MFQNSEYVVCNVPEFFRFLGCSVQSYFSLSSKSITAIKYVVLKETQPLPLSNALMQAKKPE